MSDSGFAYFPGDLSLMNLKPDDIIVLSGGAKTSEADAFTASLREHGIKNFVVFLRSGMNVSAVSEEVLRQLGLETAKVEEDVR